MSAVSDPGETNGRPEVPPEASGVLGNLPRTRPQRSSPRRAAARQASSREQPAPRSEDGAAAAKPAKPRKSTARKPKAASASPGRARARATGAAQAPAAAQHGRRSEEVPRQGFATEDERAVGAVQPPGGLELIGTAAEIVSEIAKAGVSGGERLVRDILSRLPR